MRGFWLNNELTDFSAAPSDASGLIANQVQAGKRPRSSMAPTIVFQKAAGGGRGDVRMATRSPGGAAIIQFVVKAVVGVLDWGLDAQQATAMMNFGSSNSVTTGLGGEHPNLNVTDSGSNDALVTGLRALGHTVSVAAQSSGVSTIVLGKSSDGKLQSCPTRYEPGAGRDIPLRSEPGGLLGLAVWGLAGSPSAQRVDHRIDG
ncbi:MAG: gamma-glutamyltransferase, partial [Rubrivivax sp.]|nr:gamma-glutamyltransferase [Rubrivivax sp.]